MARASYPALDALVHRAADHAMRAAADLIRRRGVTSPDLDALAAALRRRVKDAIPEALQDAREALDCGMRPAAETTFLASLTLAAHSAVDDVHPAE